MQLLNKALEQRFAALGEQDIPDPVVVCKFFDPTGGFTWYATAYVSEDRCFFGWVHNACDPDCSELGYFSLDELQSVRGKWGLGIERDLHFKECNLSEIKKLHKVRR